MELDERKKKILALIVENYIESAEPVGSKQISENYESDISSATIRNEMKLLEDEGYLEKPHISAGRVPSTLGYRYYVDNLMKMDNLSMVDIDYINNNIVSYGNIEKTIEHAADVISKLLNMPIVLDIKSNDTIENIKILKVSEKMLLIILMSNSGSVKDVIVQITDNMPDASIEELSKLLNQNLKGTPMEGLSSALNMAIKKELKKFEFILDAMNKVISKDDENRKANVKADFGNMLALPEFSSADEIKKFLNVVSTKDIINEVLEKVNQNDISVIIGNEHNELLLKDYSLISLDIAPTETTCAKLGLVAPKRVDYKRAISALKVVNEKLKKIFDKGKEESDGPG